MMKQYGKEKGKTIAMMMSMKKMGMEDKEMEDTEIREMRNKKKKKGAK